MELVIIILLLLSLCVVFYAYRQKELCNELIKAHTEPALYLNKNGKIISADERLKNIFPDLIIPSNKLHFSELFINSEFESLNILIAQGLKSNIKIKKQFSFNDKGNLKSIEVIFMPVKIFNRISSYVISFVNTFNAEQNFIYQKAINKLAHDIKSPLSTSLLAIKNLQFILSESESRVNSSHESIEFIHSALESIEHVKEKINTLTAFTRISKKYFKAVEIISLIDLVLSSFQGYFQKGVTLTKEYDSNLPLAWIDEKAIRIALKNLIADSLKAMDHSGILTLAIKNSEGAKNITSNDKQISIEIIDNRFSRVHSVENQNKLLPLKNTEIDEDIDVLIAKKIIASHDSILSTEGKPGVGVTRKFSLRAFIEKHSGGGLSLSHLASPSLIVIGC
jgi:nitrogen-specific signal transduction histidine kinase